MRNLDIPSVGQESGTAKEGGAASGARSESQGLDPAIAERSFRGRRRLNLVWTAVGSIILLGVAVYVLNVLSVPVGVLIWTVIIVFCLRGIVNGLEARGVNRGAGTAIAYVVMFVVVGVVCMLMFSPIFGFGAQFTDLLQSIPGYAQGLIDWGNSLYERYSSLMQNDTVQKWINDALSSIGDAASSFAREGATGVVAFGTGVANSVMAMGFGLVVAFWTLMELPALGREIKRIAGPSRQEDLEMLHVTFTRVMGGYIKATLIQCAIIGVCCGVCFAILGIPNYAALGIIAGILNIIPVVGPWLGGALAAVVGVFVSPLAAIVALVATIAIQQIVYTFVSPKLMQNSVDVHPALTILALLVGSAAGGAMSGVVGSIFGMLVSIPAVAVTKALFVYYFEKRTGRQIVAEDGVFFKGAPPEGEGVDPLADVTAPHPDVSAAMARIEVRKDKAKHRRGHRERDEHKH